MPILSPSGQPDRLVHRHGQFRLRRCWSPLDDAISRVLHIAPFEAVDAAILGPVSCQVVKSFWIHPLPENNAMIRLRAVLYRRAESFLEKRKRLL